MIDIVKELGTQTRLFQEPTAPRPSRESIVKEIAEAVEIANTLTCELRRMENRLVLLQSKVEGLEVGI